jgi:hypothetical protein
MFFFLAYVSLGAYVFMLIEASTSSSTSNQFTPPTEEIRTALSGTGTSMVTTTSGPTTTTEGSGYEGDVVQMKELMTRQVLDKLWDITENLNILYKENWTRLAAGEIYRFHETMYLWMKKDCNNRRKSQEMTAVQQQHATTAATPRGPAAGQQHRQNTVKWNYPTAFLYALSVITTLGKWSLKGLNILQPATIITCNKTTQIHCHSYQAQRRHTCIHYLLLEIRRGYGYIHSSPYMTRVNTATPNES